MSHALILQTLRRCAVVVITLLVNLWGTDGQFSQAADSSASPKISYYHWANTYTNQPTLIQTYQPAHLYLKLLDIGYQHPRLVINPTQIETPPTVPVIPVVFVDNAAMQDDQLETLYQQIHTHIPPNRYQSLQVDCDWTEQTRETYFSLLQRLQTDYSDLSVTLRLHQIKYAKRTGVPPAKRALLMYYNMSEIRDPETDNYILDNVVGKTYLYNFAEYPLPLDLALPLYQQTRIIRDSKLVHLAAGITPTPDKTELLAANHYRVTQGHYWQDYYLYPEDELRLDTVDLPLLQQATQLLAPLMQPNEIIFYTLNDADRFEAADLNAIANTFTSRSQTP